MNWRQEFSSAIKSTRELSQYLNCDEELLAKDYPVFIPLSLAQQIKSSGRESIMWKQFVPSKLEAKTNGLTDPIGDFSHQKAPGLIHRYKNRALFTPTTKCPVVCRYCFRKNELYDFTPDFSPDEKKIAAYIKKTPSLEEIIFTGGDPFILSSEKIERHLSFFAQFDSIKYIRFHTRTPIIMPSRINNDLIATLLKFKKKFNKLQIVIHINHSDELTAAVKKSLLKLTKNFNILSQSVLLKGINDDVDILERLFKNLSDRDIRPYYLHHPDQVKGGMHFYLPLNEGRRLYAGLRTRLPGWALPSYVIDINDGSGKVSAFNPESYDYAGQLIDKSGELRAHREPEMTTSF